ncbi:PEP-CTERM sorting domain-containing protein [Accumulibacter sp.]|uniref:PEP-CTERM sorting domain-containing protein n=1 Tax=Accumulibacter sp. TaxID=2053492 RepID=UPI0026022F40|nr:PEP-CTERM sorting domain-containing protein [Accumulibacter sp.]
MSKSLLIASFGFAMACGSSSASAELFDRGAGLIYDSDLNITWISDPNLGRGSVFDDGVQSTDGRMTYDSAVGWASSLVFAGYSDWRLPKAPERDTSCSLDNSAVNYGFGCSRNELGHLFYTEFLANAGHAVSNSGSPYLAFFAPIADETGATPYWFDNAWCCDNKPGFEFAGGELVYGPLNSQYFAWAVRDGDISPIPEPSTTSMLLSSLILAAWFRRRYFRNSIIDKTKLLSQ